MNSLSKTLLLHQILLLIFMITWFYLSIDPLEGDTWLAENILLIISFIFLIEKYESLPLSDASYIMIFILAILQTIGSHYTYAQVPIGFDVAEYFDLARNHYDRLVHFVFGLLLALPVKEYLAPKVLIKSTTLSLTILVLLFLGLGGLYEVLEWGYTFVSSPDSADEFLGEQGDKWDAQKDILLAGVGAFITLFLISIFSKKT